MLGRRILVLAPHPDDEVVGCAAAIGRVRARGARVVVLYLTTGVPAPIAASAASAARYAARVERRRAEALAVAERLDVEPAAFLGCPARQLRRCIPQTRVAIRAELERVRADALWAPAYEGGHQDHDVASFLASGFGRDLPVVEFAEYNNDGRLRSQEFPGPRGVGDVLMLCRHERASKQELLRAYRSERANLRHVRLERESLRPQARYDYGRRPHAGPLFYERFQWIPFRHPRVDFTRAEEVCAALVAAEPDSRRSALLPSGR